MVERLDNQIKSKDRVAEHGEVYTNKREVDSMLNLVKNETERVDSRFLEPACGTGNFLVEVLKRKLNAIENKYSKFTLEINRYSFIAVSSLYGIDILEDNVKECKSVLLNAYKKWHKKFSMKNDIKNKLYDSVSVLLEKNIIHGDALTLMKANNINEPIVFSEWSPINSVLIKRRDYTLHELLANAPIEGPNLFSDLNEEVFIPTPIREFHPIHYLRIGEIDD